MERELVRGEAVWTPDVERCPADAGEDPESRLPAAAGLLRASWSEDGRNCAVAAVAVLRYVLDMGERRGPRRHRWVPHLRPAERTPALRCEDHRLSDDVHRGPAARTHGRPADGPGTSRFLLPDLDLTFAEIAARRGGWDRLAYLSACETTHTTRALADEAVHFTSAFLLAGFSGVIGTLWRVPDAVAGTTARMFYEALATARDEPARTARQARVHYGDAPAAWAAHHHVGI